MFALVAGALPVLALAGATVTVAAPTAHQPDGEHAAWVTIEGSVAGGVQAAEFYQPLTFVFTEKNKGPRPVFDDVVLTQLVSNDLTASSCVLPGGALINPDARPSARSAAAAASWTGLSFCEPGELDHGQTATMIVNTRVNNEADHISARACVLNENTGAIGPCLTLFVKQR